MRILVTGVSGFVGSRLARLLTAKGHQVTGTYIRDTPQIEGVEVIEVDLLDKSLLEKTISNASPQAIAHLAGLSHVGESWKRPADYFQVNVLGSENVLDAAPKARVLVASSAEVYGAVPEVDQPIKEDRLLAPQSPYALSKAAMERLAVKHQAIVVRSFNIVGPGQADNFALPAFAKQLAENHADEKSGELRVGNLAARRDFVHIDDAVDAMALLLTTGEEGEIYNLGSGMSYSIEEALHELIDVSGLSPLVVVDPERFRPVDLPHLQADITRLGSLGWKSSRSLSDALRDLWFAMLESRSGKPASDVTSSSTA